MSERARFYYKDPRAPTPMRRQIGALALIERDGRVLVERRSDSELWGFVGGRVNDDESVEAALRREVHEETGFELERIELFGVFSDPTRIIAYPGGTVVRLFTLAFRASALGRADPRRSAESLDLRFCDRAELEMLDFAATHHPIRDRYLAGSAPVVID